MLIMGKGRDDNILVMFVVNFFKGFLPRMHPQMSCLVEVCALRVLF